MRWNLATSLTDHRSGDASVLGCLAVRNALTRERGSVTTGPKNPGRSGSCIFEREGRRFLPHIPRFLWVRLRPLRVLASFGITENQREPADCEDGGSLKPADAGREKQNGLATGLGASCEAGEFVRNTSTKLAKIGRDDWIRTSDPLTPSQVRYQAAPHPEIDAGLTSSCGLPSSLRLAFARVALRRGAAQMELRFVRDGGSPGPFATASRRARAASAPPSRIRCARVVAEQLAQRRHRSVRRRWPAAPRQSSAALRQASAPRQTAGA